MKYLDKLKSDPRVASISNEGTGQNGDGVFVSLHVGWVAESTGTHEVHEWTIADLREAMKTVVPCSCEECSA
jgi:hypothetical protein